MRNANENISRHIEECAAAFVKKWGGVDPSTVEMVVQQHNDGSTCYRLQLREAHLELERLKSENADLKMALGHMELIQQETEAQLDYALAAVNNFFI